VLAVQNGGFIGWIIAAFASPLGVVVLAALDSTLFFSLPFGIDAAVIMCAANAHDGFAWAVPFLATLGSAAPFIGLFGTVWGIMNSFTAIAQTKDTSLAVVAPGIAEALFATAVGLAAAIPAVVAYNQITVALGRASDRMTPAVAGLARTLSRNGIKDVH